MSIAIQRGNTASIAGQTVFYTASVTAWEMDNYVLILVFNLSFCYIRVFVNICKYIEYNNIFCALKWPFLQYLPVGLIFLDNNDEKLHIFSHKLT